MKRLLLIFCSCFFMAINSHAQLNPIPNAGFETWYYTQFWTIEADQWYSNNSSIAAWNVVPDSVSHTGLLGLKIQNISYKGTVWAEFPLSQHPVALDCFVKNGLNLGDTAIIRVHIYLSGILVDSGYAEIYGGIGTMYLPFSINISQNVPFADSCAITLEGGNMYMSGISFDDLSFSFPTSASEQTGDKEWNVFPNPFRESFTITYEGNTSENLTFALTDLSGRIISQEKLSAPQNRRIVNTLSLAAGPYILQVNGTEKRTHLLIIKN